MREWILGGLLAIAAGLVVAGFAQFSTRVALIVGGVLLAVFAWLVFGEVPDVEVGE